MPAAVLSGSKNSRVVLTVWQKQLEQFYLFLVIYVGISLNLASMLLMYLEDSCVIACISIECTLFFFFYLYYRKLRCVLEYTVLMKCGVTAVTSYA